MKKIIKLSRLVPLLFVVAACSSAQDCNPDQAGFFSGMGCSMGGGYQQRTDNLQTQLGHEQQNASQQQQNANQMHQQATDLQNSLAARKNELTKIDSQAWKMRQQLDNAKKNHSLTSQQLKQKQKQLDNFNAKRAQVTTDPSQQDLNALSNLLGKM